MKLAYRICDVLTYLMMVYNAFTAIVCGASLCKPLSGIFSFIGAPTPNGKYAVFGYTILFVTLGGFIAAIVLNILKLRWSSFFVLLGTAIARLYAAVVFFNRAGMMLTDGVFAKHHLWIVPVAVFALVSTLCYKMHQKNERGITFQKTEHDRQLAQEKSEAGESAEIM